MLITPNALLYLYLPFRVCPRRVIASLHSDPCFYGDFYIEFLCFSVKFPSSYVLFIYLLFCHVPTVLIITITYTWNLLLYAKKKSL